MKTDEFVVRPFESLPHEGAWVALREILPAASMSVTVDVGAGPRTVMVVTALPGLAPAWYREDGTVLIGLQTEYSSSDRSRDIAQAIIAVLAAKKGEMVESIDVRAEGPRLQDIVVGEPGPLTIHDDYSFLAPDDGEPDEATASAIEQAGQLMTPTAAIDGVDDAYWIELSGREFVRWVRTEDEDELFDAMARLHAARQLRPLDGAKYAGAFRACGLVIPVWELPRGTQADEVAGPLAQLGERLDEALANGGELSAGERQARGGLVSRSLTLR